MKIPPADDDRKEFFDKLKDRVIYSDFSGDIGGFVWHLDDTYSNGYISSDWAWLFEWIESKRKEWIELGIQMGKEEASKS